MADAPQDLAELLRAAADRWPSSEFVFPDARATYAEMAARVRALAGVLRGAGVRPGDHVGIWIPPSLETIAAIFACFEAGAVAVPMSDRFQPEEMAYVIELADVTALVTVPGGGVVDRPADLRRALPGLAAAAAGPDAELALPEAPKLRRIVLAGAAEAPAGFTAEHAISPEPPVPGTTQTPELAYLMYTSGTSAAPKACMITHAGCMLQADSVAFQRFLLDEHARFWCPLPLFHTAGLSTLMSCLAAGSSFVHTGPFEPGRALELLGAERCTHAIPAFDTIWMRVLDHPDFGATDLSALRVVMMSAGEVLVRRLQARMPQTAYVANYGMTEATGHVSMSRPDDPLDVRVSTSGFPVPGMEVRVVDPETLAPVAPGERGEIQYRGASRFAGYYRDAAATQACLLPGGWFRTGDLGVRDAAGRLSWAGRLKDMLKVGGENVAALEVESYLRRHPAVGIVAVVGAPDAYYGEVPAAFIELAPGAALTEQEVIDFCLDEIATFKVPRYVRFVTEWPMSGTKIRKFVLRDRLAAELAGLGIAEAPRLRSTRARARHGGG